LRHAGFHHEVQVRIHKIEADEAENEGLKEKLHEMDGVLIPGGFGARGIEGKIQAAGIARENGIPYFGICLGMQVAVIEFARNVCGMDGAHSTEMAPETEYPVIDLMSEQKSVQALGGTMRLGAYDCAVKEGTLGAEAYGGAKVVSERHRHRYEVNNRYLSNMTEHGLVVSGVNEATNLVEMIELRNHPWFLGVQSHPEFKSKPLVPHPLFERFIGAAKQRMLARSKNMAARSRG
jgi:CTP synthase